MTNIVDYENLKFFRNADNKVTVRVGNDGDPLEITGVVETEGVIGDILNVFGEITNIASGAETEIVKHTVPAGKIFFLQAVTASGDNIAEYNVYRDTTLIDRGRTWFTGGLDKRFVFTNSGSEGLTFTAGEEIILKVEHSRLENGDFNGKILGVQKDA